MWTLATLLALSQQIPDDQLHKVRDLVRAAETEAPWSDVPWMTSLWRARERAAKEGKPLLIWAAGGGGHPLALC
jgi:hypothetical protein